LDKLRRHWLALMNNNKEETASTTDDIDSLGMSLGKRLGRLELSGVELVEQLLVLTDRCEVMEAAVLEEHVERKKNMNMIEKVVEKLDEIENHFKASEEEHVKQNDKLKATLSKLKEDHTDLKEKFLSLVLNCQGYEEEIKRLESSNDELVEAVRNLEKDKEKLRESLEKATNHENPCEFFMPPTTTMPISPSSSASSASTTPLFSLPPPPFRSMASQPPPHVGSLPLRASASHVVHSVLFHPQYMQVYAPSPHQYMQEPYSQGFTYQEWSGLGE